METITHLDSEKNQYMTITSIYYSNGIPILTVEDAAWSAETGEYVDIDDSHYKVEKVIFDPQTLVERIHLTKMSL